MCTPLSDEAYINLMTCNGTNKKLLEILIRCYPHLNVTK